MRVVFLIPTPLRPFANGRSRIQVEVAKNPLSLGDALGALWDLAPGVRDRVVTEQGEVRPHVNVFVGTESCRWTGGLATPIAEGAEIAIFPAVSGGRGSQRYTSPLSGSLIWRSRIHGRSLRSRTGSR